LDGRIAVQSPAYIHRDMLISGGQTEPPRKRHKKL
jgi:hypothetical protein